MCIQKKLGKELLFLDGGMGTLLQKEGMVPGELPETWNIEKPEIIQKIHNHNVKHIYWSSTNASPLLLHKSV